MALEQEIIELVKLSATEDIRDTGFSFSWISIGSRSLIIIKSVSKLAEYYGQLFINIIALIVKIADDGLYFILFSLFISFYFSFLFSFNFLFLEQLGLGVISHTVTSVTNWWQSHKTDYRTWENEVEGSGTKWCHTVWTTHAGLMLYSWSFRVGCTVVSTDHEE